MSTLVNLYAEQKLITCILAGDPEAERHFYDTNVVAKSVSRERSSAVNDRK